jgi:hypothetical protein
MHEDEELKFLENLSEEEHAEFTARNMKTKGEEKWH